MMAKDMALLPDTAAIREDLEYMTQRWSELDQPAVFEIRAFKEKSPPKIGKFSPEWMDEAVDFCESLNELGFNIYAVRNPIRADLTGSASDEDVVAAFFAWADCDEPQSPDNVLRWEGPKFSAAVITGTEPSQRVHAYWELKEPCLDMTEWRAMQIDIARQFGSDDKVINPSRIMRVGGTVSYPARHKQERGYVKELTTIRTDYGGERQPVTMDQMRRAFSAPATAPSSTFQIDTGGLEVLDREREAIKALSGDNWNAAVFKLVGSYVRKGLSDGEIHALTDPLTIAGYTVADTREEVQAMVDRTRANPKFEADAQPEPIAATPEVIADFKISSSADFLANLQPLEYLIDGILPTGVVYSLTGHAGHGKTTLALQFALAVSTGEDFHGNTTSQGSVLILAGENPYNVKWQYAAALAARGLQAADADVHFVEGRFSIDQWTEVLRAKMKAMPNLKMIIVDSLQAFFEGDNDNDNSQMVTMAHKIRELADIETRPAMLIIAHPAGKTPSKDNLVPRGGGAFLNEIDGNLTVWSQDSSQQTLHHSQKFRGAGFDPMEWVMQIHEFEHLADIHGTPLKLPVSRPELTIEAANREVQISDLLAKYLDLAEQKRAPSEREAATLWGVSRRKVRAVIDTAKDEKLIRRHARTYAITQGGKEFLEAQNAGE